MRRYKAIVAVAGPRRLLVCKGLLLKDITFFMLFDGRKKRLDFRKLTGLVILVCYLFLASSINLFHTCARSHATEGLDLPSCVHENSCCLEENGEQRVEKLSQHNGLHRCPACVYVTSNHAPESKTLSGLFVVEADVRQAIYETFLLSQNTPSLLRGRAPPVVML